MKSCSVNLFSLELEAIRVANIVGELLGSRCG